MRQRISLDGAWQFFPDPGQCLSPEALGQAEPRMIAVPGPWQAQFDDLSDYSGVAWYRRIFDPPSFESSGMSSELGTSQEQLNTQNSTHKTSMLHFGAVDYHATVWLNGRQLGEHEGGYLPFEFDASAALRYDGPNELVVCVIDPGDDASQFPEYPFAEIPHGKQSWYGPISGIWQSVYLEARAATHIARLRVTPDVAGEQAELLVLLSRPAERALALQLTLTGPNGQQSIFRHAVEAGSSQHAATLPVPSPLLWDTEAPHLYRVEAALFGGRRRTKDQRRIQARLRPSSLALRPTRWPPISACARSPPRRRAT